MGIRQTEINRLIGSELDLTLKTRSSVLDAVKAVDKDLLRKTSTFPVEGSRSLLHMVYHPTEERFNKQTAVQLCENRGLLSARGVPVRIAQT